MRFAKAIILTCAVVAAAAGQSSALTIKNTDTKENSVGVDTGAKETVYKVPANGSVEIVDDCANGCAITGPWGYSRAAATSDTIETDGKSLVTRTAPASFAKSAPQPAAVAKTNTKSAKAYAKKGKKQYAKAKPKYFKGSFASLFAGA